MRHYPSLENLHLQNTWVSVGVFDGVHCGHQALLKKLAVGARQAGAASTVITFFPNPGVVLGKIPKAYYLTSPDVRAELMGKLGIENVITVEFTHELSMLSAKEFMQILKERLDLRQLLVGDDFALGHGREGNISRLREIGSELDYQLTVFPPVSVGKIRVSSTKIRNFLQEGEVDRAAEMLGRFYRVSGRVTHGDGRGKQLGFATANLDFWKEQLMPPAGVYATWVWLEDKRFASVSNLGVRPTFDQAEPQQTLEAHLLDFERDLYDADLALEFVKRIRPEKRFSSIEALVDQVNRDKITAKEILSHAP